MRWPSTFGGPAVREEPNSSAILRGLAIPALGTQCAEQVVFGCCYDQPARFLPGAVARC